MCKTERKIRPRYPYCPPAARSTAILITRKAAMPSIMGRINFVPF